MIFYSQEAFVIHQQKMALYHEILNTIESMIQSPIDSQEKIRIIMHQGGRLLGYKYDAHVLANTLDFSDPNIVLAQNQLGIFLSIPAEEILQQNAYFGQFAFIAFYFGELHLIEKCLTNGAYLEDKQYFSFLYNQLQYYPDYNNALPTLNLLISSETLKSEAEPITIPVPAVVEPAVEQVIEPVIETNIETIIAPEIIQSEIENQTPAQTQLTEREILSIEISHAAIALNAIECNKYLSATDPEQIGICLEQIENQLTNDTLVSHSSALANFIKQLELPIEKCVLWLKLQYLKTNIKHLLLEKLLGYADAEFYQIDQKYNLGPMIGLILNKKNKSSELSKQLKSKIKACNQAFTIEATPKKPETIPSEAAITKVKNKEKRLDTTEIKQSPQQLLDIALKNYDHISINTAIGPEAKNLRQTLDAICEKIITAKEKVPVEFINQLKLPVETVIYLIKTRLLPKEHTIALVAKSTGFSLQEFYQYQQELDLLKINQEYNTPEFHLGLTAALNFKYSQSLTWATEQAEKLFKLIETTSPDTVLDLKACQNVTNVCNNKGQTPLMLCLARGFNRSTINALIERSDDSIFYLDSDNQNVFHYWAKSLSSKTAGYIDALWNKFLDKAHAAKCVVHRLNVRNFSEGNTFLHILCMAKSEDHVITALNKVFAQQAGIQISIAALLKNKRDLSVLDILEEKQKIWYKVTGMIHERLAACMFNLCTQFPQYINDFFPARNTLYSGNKESNIISKLIAQHEFYKLIDLLVDRYAFHRLVEARFFVPLTQLLDNPEGYDLDKLRPQIVDYFGEDEFYDMYREKMLHEHIYEHIIKEQDQALEHYLVSRLVLHYNTKPPVTETLTWKAILRHIDPADSFNFNNKSLKQATEFLINYSYNHDTNKLWPIDYALQSNNVKLVEFVQKQCQIEICDRILTKSIALMTLDNVHIADFCLKNHKASIDYKVRDKLAAYFYYKAIFTNGDEYIVRWLIMHGFNTSKLLDDGRNVLQRLLGSVTDASCDTLLRLTRVLFTKVDEVPSLLQYKDNNGHHSYDYLFNRRKSEMISQESFTKIFEFLLQNSFELLDLGMPYGRSILQLTMCTFDYAIFEVYIKYLDTDNIQVLVSSSDVRNGDSTMQIIEKNVAAGLLDQKFITKFQELSLQYNNAAPKPAPSI